MISKEDRRLRRRAKAAEKVWDVCLPLYDAARILRWGCGVGGRALAERLDSVRSDLIGLAMAAEDWGR